MYNFPDADAVMPMYAIRTLEQMRRGETNAPFHLIGEPRNHPDRNFDIALAEALSDNDTVETVSLYVAPPTHTHLNQWRSLLRTIQSGRAGKGIRSIEIHLFHADRARAMLSTIQQRQVGEVVGTLLQQIEGLSSLECLNFDVPRIPAAAVSSFLDAAPQVFRTFSWPTFDVDSSDGIQAVAAAMNRRHNIKPLRLTVPCSAATELLLKEFAKTKVKIGQDWNAPLNFLVDDRFTDVHPEMIGRIFRFKLTCAGFTVRSEAVYNAIMGSLESPSPTWLHLHIIFRGANEWTDAAWEAAPRTWLNALKSNLKLRSLTIGDLDDGNIIPFFNSDAERDEHRFYMDRNRSLRDWIDNPSTVPEKELWFRALRLAMLAGHDELYEALKAVFPSQIETIVEGRSKKRTTPPNP